MLQQEEHRRDRTHNRSRTPSPATSILATGWRIGVEMVVAVGLCVLIGRLIDSWLNTQPWGLIVMFFLGAAAGIRNVYRNASAMLPQEKEKE